MGDEPALVKKNENEILSRPSLFIYFFLNLFGKVVLGKPSHQALCEAEAESWIERESRRMGAFTRWKQSSKTFFTGGKWTAITPKFWVIAFLFIYSFSFPLGCYKRQPVGRCHWMDDAEAFFFDKLSPCCIWERGGWRTICFCIHGNSTYHCWSPHCYYSLPSEQQFMF